MSASLQQPTSRSLSDRLRFAQYAEFHVTLPPDDCLDLLMGLDRTRQGCLSFPRIRTYQGKTTPDAYEVRVVDEQRSRGHYTNAEFAGTILRANIYGQTVITGKFRLGRVPLLQNMVWFPILFLFVYRFPHPAFIAFAAASVLSELWGIRSGYRRVRALVNRSLTPLPP